MAQAGPERTPTPFEAFVRRIAAVPKAKVDALEAAERAEASVKAAATTKRPK
jgi:hypothetical protein